MLRTAVLSLLLVVPLQAQTLDAAAPPAVAGQQSFDSWLHSFRQAAAARGLSEETLDTVLNGLAPNPRVIALDRNQPDASTPSAPASFANYLARRLDTARISAGKTAAARVTPSLIAIEGRYGVPSGILLGIWGMETSYGRVTGNLPVAQSLATLAWDGRRAALFTNELNALLEIIENRRANQHQMVGSWAGAMGQPQFLPSSYLAYAVDGDGDGRADIWASEADTLASIANYLQKNGWQPGVRWGQAVELPPAFDRQAVRNPETPTTCVRPLSVHTKWLPASQWQALGLKSAQEFPPATTLMTLVEPDGPEKGAWLVTQNYRTLMTYNCSNFYALSVALLGDELQAPAR